jgi:LysM repeat protein
MPPSTPELSAPDRLRRICCGFVLLAVSFFAANSAGAGNLIYKNYLVRYDRGWDILCEPYTVQTGDWIYKIFRQKGEISNKDFREFLGIFARLNPHVQDIDLLRPGQAIDIPLRKMEHGTLPGQDSGVVTIPFVSLGKETELLKENTQPYAVQRGDTISKLVVARFGGYGTQAYNEGNKLLQAANPQITDINRIYAGQKIHIPDPSIREKEGYAAMYDAQGNIQTGGPAQPATAAAGMGASGPATDQAHTPEADTPQDRLAAAAAVVGGKLLNKGTYYVPTTNELDFEIDLSQHPMMALQNTTLIFARDGRIMQHDADTVRNMWPETKTVAYDEQLSVEQIVAGIFEAVDGRTPNADEIVFDDQGILVAVRAKWVKPEADQRRLCITPVGSRNEQTPESMRRYLEQHGIVIRELLPGGGGSSATDSGRHAIKDILAITHTGQKDFVSRLARVLDFSYAPNVPITFTYAGMSIQAYADLISTQTGNEILVDFGDLYGDTLQAIRQGGQVVVQIEAQDDNAAIIRKMLGGLGETYAENPAFLAAARPAEFNTTITVPGVMYAGAENKRTLLSGVEMPPAVSDLLSANGVAVVTW